MKKIVVTLLFLFCGLPSFSGGCDNWKQEIYPQQLLNLYSREYLNEYCSAPKETQTDQVISRYGEYQFVEVKKGEAGYLNSKYAPDSTIYPFRSKAGQARADYYFQKGLQMPRPQSK